jgi:hypothetical protein
MIYVEYLRVRTSLAWHAGILVVLTLVILATNHSTSVIVNGHPAVTAGAPISLALLVPIAAFFGAIYASSLGTSLNRENVTRDISWTKPVSRTMLALQYVLVDLAGIVIAFAIAMLAVLAVIVRIGVVPVIDGPLVPQLALGLGIAAMWYALVQVLTFWFGPGARAVGGILWPVALLSLAMAGIPGAYGALARAVNLINPIAYLTTFSANGDGGNAYTFWTPVDTRTLVVWFFTVLFCAIAITFWRRKEA